LLAVPLNLYSRLDSL